jgi:hypothetical protein
MVEVVEVGDRDDRGRRQFSMSQITMAWRSSDDGGDGENDAPKHDVRRRPFIIYICMYEWNTPL